MISQPHMLDLLEVHAFAVTRRFLHAGCMLCLHVHGGVLLRNFGGRNGCRHVLVKCQDGCWATYA